MSGKTENQFFFEVDLHWLRKQRGVLSAKDAEGTIHVATPQVFGGEGKPWTPEHLFLSAISSCFMTTYLAFAKKLKFEISNFACEAVGQIRLVDGKYKFTRVDLFPKVFIANVELEEKARSAMEKTHKYCLISNSVDTTIFYHSEVLVGAVLTEMDRIKPARFTIQEAQTIGEKLGMDFGKYDINEFRRGLEVELEHGKRDLNTNVTNDDPYLTGKIAWAHLNELPDYYTRLDKMELEGEGKNEVA